MLVTSANGILFLEDSESVVLTAYADLGGVITIAGGLTELSRSFKRIWRAEHGGRPLKKGDTVTLGDARRYMKRVLAEEFEPAARTVRPKEQHVMDGVVSVLWNCGTGAASWKWAQAIRSASAFPVGGVEYKANIGAGCKRLLSTAITSAGKVWRGLQDRRKREARLIEFADYGRALLRPTKVSPASKTGSAISTDEESIKAYQRQLAALGLYKGTIDGRTGKDTLTEGAVKNFQRANGLRVDGVVGPATRSALATAVRAKNQTITGFGGATVTTGGAGIGLQMDGSTLLVIAAVAVVVILVGFAVWNNRGRLLGVRTPA